MKRFAFPTVVFLILGACGDATGRQVLGPESAAGRYDLVSLDGTPLPTVVAQVLANTIEVTAGHYQLDSDGTCSTSTTARATTLRRSGQIRICGHHSWNG